MRFMKVRVVELHGGARKALKIQPVRLSLLLRSFGRN